MDIKTLKGILKNNSDRAEGIAEDIEGNPEWKEHPLALGIAATANEIKVSLDNLVPLLKAFMLEAIGADKELIKPTKYYYICHGGGTMPVIDEFGKEEFFKCKYAGHRDWGYPACEKCDGKIKGDKMVDDWEAEQNRRNEKYNQRGQEITSRINKMFEEK